MIAEPPSRIRTPLILLGLTVLLTAATPGQANGLTGALPEAQTACRFEAWHSVTMEVDGPDDCLEVRAGWGDLTVEGVVDIQDASGGIEVPDVDGDTTIQDGSGIIHVRRVTGHFRVLEDGSGNIRAHRILGDFLVYRDGSGDIGYSNIYGRVSLPRR